MVVSQTLRNTCAHVPTQRLCGSQAPSGHRGRVGLGGCEAAWGAGVSFIPWLTLELWSTLGPRPGPSMADTPALTPGLCGPPSPQPDVLDQLE